MTAIAIDLETIPTTAALALPYPEADRQPPGNYKSDEAIAKWREADRAEWETGRIKTYSLNPRFGRIAAIGFCDGSDDYGSWSSLAETEADEALLIMRCWDYIVQRDVVLTWNGLGFDLPFLVTRSILLGLTPPFSVAPYLKRYSIHPHCDVKQVLLNWPAGHPKGEGLGEWAEALGLGGKTAHGAEVWGMWQRGELEAICNYAAADAALTYKIAERIAPWYGLSLGVWHD